MSEVKPDISRNKSLTDKTVNGFLWLTTGSGVQSVLQIAILAILARLITPESFGIAQAALIVVGFAKLLGQMGVGPAIVQQKELRNDHIRSAFTISLTFGIILGLITYLSSDMIASFFLMSELSKILKVLSIVFVIESFVIVSKALLQRKMRLKVFSIANVISYFIGYGAVAIVLGYLNYGVWALIIAMMSQIFIKAIIVSYLEPHSIIPVFKIKEIKELINFGGGVTIAQFSNYLASQADNIFIGKFIGADALGLYSRAYALMVKPVNLIGGAVDQALFPTMSSIQDDINKLKSGFYKGIGGIAFFSFPISVLMIILAPEIVAVILGPNWTDAIIPLQILSVGLSFRMGYKVNDTIARATGKVYQGAWRQAIYAINVFIGAVIGVQWGVEGVAFGVVAALFIHYILTAQLSLKLTNSTWSNFIHCHVTAIINSFIIGILTFGMIYILRINEFGSLSSLIIVCLINLAISILLVYAFPNQLIGKYNQWIFKRYFRRLV